MANLPFIFSPDGMPVSTSKEIVVAAMQRRGLDILGIEAASVVNVDGVIYYQPKYGGGSSRQSPFRVTINGTNAAVGVRFKRTTTSIIDTAYIGLLTLSSGSISLAPVDYSDTSVRVLSAALGINTVVSCPSFAAAPFFELVVTPTHLMVFINSSEVFTHLLVSPVTVVEVRTAVGAYTGHAAHSLRDIYINTVRLGEGSVVRLTHNDLVSNSGTLTGTEAQVYDIDNTTAYVSNSEGQTTTWSLNGVADNPLTIAAVQITTLGRKSGTTLSPEEVYVNGELVASPILGVGVGAYTTTLTLDPTDSTEWTKAKLNTLTVGVGGA